MIPNNVDLNIWDKLGYETEYEKEGWVLTPYTIVMEGAQFGTGRELTEYEISLTKAEARALTLGVAMRDGGDYAPDSDFWIDAQTFYLTYRNIPPRVDGLLRSLLNVVYNMAEEEFVQYQESRVY